MNSPYEFLKPYQQQSGRLEFPYNSFGLLYAGELEEAEKVLGKEFLSQLREFYKAIGVGCLLKPHVVPQDYVFYNTNEILPPTVAANFAF